MKIERYFDDDNTRDIAFSLIQALCKKNPLLEKKIFVTFKILSKPKKIDNIIKRRYF